MSSFGGRIQEYPNISVDRFDGLNLQSTAFFLSHLHVDHMVGLTSSNFHNVLRLDSRKKLYAHALTCELLAAKPELKHLVPFCVPLSINVTSSIGVPNRAAKKDDYSVLITAIGSGHCVGSVMFLFESDRGNVLYTGDFRLQVGASEKIQSFKSISGLPKQIDNLYLDTTFCHNGIEEFPSRQESANVLQKIVEEWINKSSSHVVILQYNCSLGCEFIYKRLSEHFSTKIHFSPDKHKINSAIPEMSVFSTDDPQSTQIHACERNSACARKGTVLQVTLSTMAFMHEKQSSPRARLFVKVKPDWYRIFYSIHCSLNEIKDFVLFLKPKKIIPCVVKAETSASVKRILDDLLAESTCKEKTDEYRPLGQISDWLQKRKRRISPPTSDSDSELDFGEDFKKKKN